MERHFGFWILDLASVGSWQVACGEMASQVGDWRGIERRNAALVWTMGGLGRL
jgi:hypothetical protein